MQISIMWDDGLVSDLKLMEFLRDLGATSSFAIAPSRHKAFRCPNDSRGDYGTLVTKGELQEFRDFEVCNHTFTHAELTRCRVPQIREEIHQRKTELEQIFQTRVDGFCFPYGCFEPSMNTILEEVGCKYGRTTLSLPGKITSSLPLLHTSGGWNCDLDRLIEESDPDEKIVLWGHSYELRTDSLWDDVFSLYSKIMKDTRIELVDFGKLIQE